MVRVIRRKLRALAFLLCVVTPGFAQHDGSPVLRINCPALWSTRLIHTEPVQNQLKADWRGCCRTVTYSIGDGSQSPSTRGLWDLKKVESSLRNAGFKVRRDVAVTQPFLSIHGRVLLVEDGEVELQTYIYKSPHQRAADTDKLDPKTVTPPTTRVAWLMPPSLVANRNLAAIVLTHDEALRRKIMTLLNK